MRIQHWLMMAGVVGANNHAATFWWKTRSLPVDTSLLATLPVN